MVGGIKIAFLNIHTNHTHTQLYLFFFSSSRITRVGESIKKVLEGNEFKKGVLGLYRYRASI